MITINNLSKTYISEGKKVEALKNINLTINDGEIFGIMGSSGAGKSSLLRCINLLETPTSGEVLIDGINITKLNPNELRSLRKKIGMIFQHFNLLMNATVFENIAFPLEISGIKKNEIVKRVNELLEVVELKEKKDAYPSQLSGGQKQRVGIARALANNPGIILCDEATSALDPSTTESIIKLLKDINKKYGITIVVVTHEMSVIKNLCSSVAVIEDGVVVEWGKVIDVFSNPKTKTSKKFLKDILPHASEDVLLECGRGEKLLRLTFIGDNAGRPVISNMVKKFDVDANILSGSIEAIQGTQFGNLIVKLGGNNESINNAIEYLKNSNLKIEVINDGVN